MNSTVTLTIINEKNREREIRKTEDLWIKGHAHCSHDDSHTNILAIRPMDFSVKTQCRECKRDVTFSFDDDIIFHCYLSFSSAEDTYLPPFLPSFSFKVPQIQYHNIIQRIKELTRIIRLQYGNQKHTIYEQIKLIGTMISQLDSSNGSIGTTVRRINESDCQNLIIFTNDASIPWHWAYDVSNRTFLVDRFSCGTIFVESITNSLNSFFEAKQRLTEKVKLRNVSLKSTLEGKYCVLLRGQYDNERSPRMQIDTSNELDKIQEMIIDRLGFKQDQIIGIPDDQNSTAIIDQVRNTFAKREISENIEIIHYSGHMDTRGDMTILYPGYGYGTDIGSDCLCYFDFISEPLVFLNGCNSGHITDIWDKSANFATALLNRHASGCIVTLNVVEEEMAHDFSVNFYKSLLEAPDHISYGQALKKARDYIYERDSCNPMRFLFHLFGDPNAKLVYVKADSDYAEEFLREHHQKIG